MSPKTNEIILHISPKEKRIKIESKSADKGEYQSFLSADCIGKEMEIHFNWRFLLGGLLRIKTPEVLIGFQEKEKPAVLRPKDDESYVYVVMPMRSPL
jgi:DNA polymerase-3 subunit beta